MKTRNFLTLIMLFVICTMQAENEEPQAWGYVETLKDEWLRAIGTQGLDTVYIVGEKGLIAKSTDQGSNWQKSYFPTEVNLNAVLFLNQQTGIAAGENGTVLKTTDAGENWTQVATPTTEHINAIARAGNNSIWAVGNSSLVMRSEDNGDSWQTVDLLAKQLNLNDIAFRESMGYIVGDSAIVYKTEDNGISWENKELIENARVWEKFTATGITGNKIFLQLHPFNLYFIKNNTFNEMLFPAFGFPNKVHFINENIGVHACHDIPTGGGYGRSIRIYKTTDEGENWNFVPVKGIQKSEDQSIGELFYSDTKIVNETIGYSILGQILLKTPSPPYNNDGTFLKEETKKSKTIKVTTSNIDNIIIESNSAGIKSINIFNISANTIIVLNSNGATKHCISTGNITAGVYIIKATLEDNTVVSTKWIKY